MIAVSLVAVICLFRLHLWGNGNLHRPISEELAEGNVGAIVLFLCLGMMTILLSPRLKKTGRRVWPWLIATNVLSLILIAVTNPATAFHLYVFGFSIALTGFFFLVMAVENYSLSLMCLSTFSLMAVFGLTLFSLGLAEKVILIVFVLSTNILYYVEL